jgi:translation initiation factor 3 subunit H
MQIHNSALIQALTAELEPVNTATQCDLDRLDLSVAPFLERNIDSLLECVDDLVAEQQKVTNHHKNVARQAQAMASWLQKRRQENQARRAAGEELLPEEDPQQFKPTPELSLLDNYLITNQLSTYCDQLNLACTQSLQKLYVFEAFQHQK